MGKICKIYRLGIFTNKQLFFSDICTVKGNVKALNSRAIIIHYTQACIVIPLAF